MPDYQSRRTMMVDTQVRPSDVTKFPIIDAMLQVSRENFVPIGQREAAYMDGNLDIATQRVVLEPRTFAKMLDALNIQPDELVLDIGAGLGYSAAIIANLAEAVVAIEEDEDMANEAQASLSEAGIDNAVVLNTALATGAGKHGPYNVITIQGAAEQVPQAVLDQLQDGGRIACLFMEGPLGVMRIGRKKGADITWRFVCNASAPVLPGFEKSREFVL